MTGHRYTADDFSPPLSPEYGALMAGYGNLFVAAAQALAAIGPAGLLAAALGRPMQTSAAATEVSGQG